MSASRAGRAALKKAKPAGQGPRTSNTPQQPRINPVLENIRRQNSTSHGISPRAMTAYGVSFLFIGMYSGYLYTSYKCEVAHSQSLNVPTDVSDRYNRTARTFDSDVNMSERLMWMGSKRRELVQMARGNVLEVSCGTGRNIEYYDLDERRGTNADGKGEVLGCRRVRFVDLSKEMVDITREKFGRVFPDYHKVDYQVQSAAEVTPPAGTGYYDTVIQTMGICSMANPVDTLRHLGSITEPRKGRILLLEHGRSYYGWLNRVLDQLAAGHADRHGCWWNRDIGEIVRESGMEVVEEKRWHFGTTWRYVLRPRDRHSVP